MKIAMVNNFYPPRVGGSALFVENLATELILLGHEVLVVTGTYGSRDDYTVDNLTVKRLRSWTFPKTKFSFNFDINFCLAPGNKKKFFEILDEFNPDIIHCHGQFMDLSWKALNYANIRNKRSFLTLHTRLYNPSFIPNLFLRFLDFAIVKPILSKYTPTKWIVIDKHFESYINRRYKVSNSCLAPIPIGVDVKQFTPRDVRTPVNSITISSIGHVIPIRNRVTLIKAFKIFSEEFPNSKLIIVGNVYDRSIFQLVRDLGIEEKVTFTGALQKKEVIRVLHNSYMEIHDVQNHEGRGLGIASLESMAMGVPIIASTPPDYFLNARIVSGRHLLEVRGDDVNDLVEKMKMLVKDKNLWTTISHEGSKWVNEHFSMEEVGKQHLRCYLDLGN